MFVCSKLVWLCDCTLPPPLRTQNAAGLTLSLPGLLPRLFFSLKFPPKTKKENRSNIFLAKLTIFPSTKSCFFFNTIQVGCSGFVPRLGLLEQAKISQLVFPHPGKNQLEITDQLGPEVTSRNLVHHQLEALPRNRLATLISSNLSEPREWLPRA